MATHGWRKSASVAEWLFDEAHAFDFFQAVSLLEQLRPELTPIGEGSDPTHEAVRFLSNVGLSFPETEIARIRKGPTPNDPMRMQVNFLGLAGALGPLPQPFVELIYQRATRGDTAARDFLDIFHHRLISFVYRIRKKHRIGLGVTTPEKDSAAEHLYALLGLGYEELRDRLGVPDRALLMHALGLSNEHRSLEGLVAILRHHFGVPIAANSLAGAFHPIEPSDRTAIGRSGKNRMLGRDTILGGRFWDQESAFELCIGPMKLDMYERFLPNGDALGPLCALVKFYAGPRYRFDVRLILEPFEMPQAKLGDRQSTRLGQLGVLGGPKKQSGRRLEIRLSRSSVAKGFSVKEDDGQADPKHRP